MFGLGEKIVTLLIDIVDTFFCIKHKLRRLETNYNPQILEAFRALNHCVRLSFCCLSIFLVLNIYTFLNNSQYIDLQMKECTYSYLCLGFLSFMRSPTDSIIAHFVECLLVYVTILFVYILYLMIAFFINKTETDFIGSNFPFSQLIFTSPTLLLNKEEDYYNYKDYLYLAMFATRENLKRLKFFLFLVNLLIKKL